jgi:hypothetical protein
MILIDSPSIDACLKSWTRLMLYTQEQIYIYDFRESSVFWCHCVARFTLQRWVTAPTRNLFPHTTPLVHKNNLPERQLLEKIQRAAVNYLQSGDTKSPNSIHYSTVGGWKNIKIKPREDKTPLYVAHTFRLWDTFPAPHSSWVCASTAGRPRFWAEKSGCVLHNWLQMTG